MMRAPLVIAALLSAFVATTALGADAQPKWVNGGDPPDGWRYAYSPSEQEAVFVLDEPQFLEQWPLVTLWTRHELKGDKPSESYSSLALMGYDCSRDGKASYALFDFPKPMLAGEPEGHQLEGDNPDWEYPPPGNPMRDHVRNICAVARTPASAATARPASAKATPQDVLAFFKEDPQLNRYVVLHDLFPAEWPIFSERVAAVLAQPEDKQDWSNIPAFLSAFIDLREKYVPLSSEGGLRRIAAAHGKLLERLRARSAQACIDYLFYDGSPDMDVDEEALALDGLVSAQLKAIHEGMTRPVKRNGVNEADTEAVAQAFKRRGGTASQWALVYEAETMKLPAKERCDTWIAYYGAIAEAPDGAAGRWAAWFFDPSDTEAPPEPEPQGFKPAAT